jgi:hypothetical protein
MPSITLISNRILVVINKNIDEEENRTIFTHNRIHAKKEIILPSKVSNTKKLSLDKYR